MGTPPTLVDIASARVTDDPHRIAFRFSSYREDTEEVDFRRLWERVAAVAQRLIDTTAPGDRVVLLCPPGPHFVHAFFACLATRRIAVAVPLPTSPHQVAAVTAIVRDSGAAAAIAPLSAVPVDGEILGRDLRIIDIDSIDGGTGLEIRCAAPTPDDIAFLQYTSGSTGSPKGVTVLHRNLVHNLELITANFGLTERNSLVSWLPPFHDMGLIQGMLLPVFVGMRATLMSPMTFLRNPLTWLRAISESENVLAGGPNLAYGLCTKRISPAEAALLDLSGWEMAFVGAEPVDPKTLRAFADTFAVSGFRAESFVPTYGLAESTLYVSGGPVGAGARPRRFSTDELERGVAIEWPTGRELLSMGPVRPEHVAVVDRATGRRCPDNRVGEIWLRGASVAAGYWNKPEQTRGAFAATIAGEDGAEYLRTGDLGFVCAGELYVSGRSKELMIVHGRNIFPQDVERTIVSNHPMLRPGGCAVFAATIDNEDRVIAVQELNDTLEPGSAAALEGSIRDIVSRVHAISLHQVVFVEKGAVPKTTSGKIQRQRLRETYSAGTALEESAL
ncbi:fatty acyl-AMP ligase [Nocardia otitidiscaviarum]|uniref:Fatty acyl-AMP ligase n=1 Tax=Nocardia otitidiscaviarum TaxID=1823 RepID=A0A516NGW7_9NOCA|nr:fatty acyl-AMP ligase [Nocardia otitidiscaviarum]MCP9622785.1 fatty acyl-AMP ligase [Nocardia otitidiscaviarum]QDP78148.1 fatty acyl-AMP ligase [Nocardia otitidiscaviarum]